MSAKTRSYAKKQKQEVTLPESQLTGGDTMTIAPLKKHTLMFAWNSYRKECHSLGATPASKYQFLISMINKSAPSFGYEHDICSRRYIYLNDDIELLVKHHLYGSAKTDRLLNKFMNSTLLVDYCGCEMTPQ